MIRLVVRVLFFLFSTNVLFCSDNIIFKKDSEREGFYVIVQLDGVIFDQSSPSFSDGNSLFVLKPECFLEKPSSQVLFVSNERDNAESKLASAKLIDCHCVILTDFFDCVFACIKQKKYVRFLKKPDKIIEKYARHELKNVNNGFLYCGVPINNYMDKFFKGTGRRVFFRSVYTRYANTKDTPQTEIWSQVHNSVKTELKSFCEQMKREVFDSRFAL